MRDDDSSFATLVSFGDRRCNIDDQRVISHLWPSRRSHVLVGKSLVDPVLVVLGGLTLDLLVLASCLVQVPPTHHEVLSVAITSHALLPIAHKTGWGVCHTAH